MEERSGISALPATGARPLERARDHLGGLLHRARGDALACRARRVGLLVMLLWIVSGFDLAFTLLAGRAGDFHEANPIAAGLVNRPGGLILYKVGMVAFASAVLLAFRRRRFTELCCWAVCAAYLGLSTLWWLYYALCEVARQA